MPLNYVEPRHAFLLARFSAVMVGEQLLFRPTAFRLLDPEAGKSSEVPADALGESVEGAYEPWLQPLPRKLQKADGANASVVWLSTQGEDGTCVGRYDTRSFRWVTEQWIPGLRVRAKTSGSTRRTGEYTSFTKSNSWPCPYAVKAKIKRAGRQN